MRRVAVLALLLLALLPGAAAAATPQFTMAEIEAELMCPTCQSRLDLSHSPAADRIRAYVERRRDEGWTKQQVKDALVADFGPSVLAAPPAAGMGLVAWLVPGALVAGGLVVVITLTLVWRRRRAPTTAAEHELDPALDERVDEALRAFGDDE